MKLLLSLPFLVLLGVGVFAIASPLRDSGAPLRERGTLVWGDSAFANKNEVRAWLRLHGESYDAWARQHPVALRLLTPQHRAATKRKVRDVAGSGSRTALQRRTSGSSVGATHAVAGAQHVADSVHIVGASRRFTSAAWIPMLFAAVLLMTALLPQRYLGHLGAADRTAGVRVGLAGIAVAILMGFAVATLFA